ncbi:MAG: 1,4-dihydroxy-6-naphthoate synthase, partial [Desulfovibrio sp.]|nr:1,4-dihydroxy-6-naphthoate synthase [Desulfovibrio sp.]
MNTLGLGISPCPNDTYIFDALIHGRIPLARRFSPRLADVEELNALARSGSLEVTKLSLAAMTGLLDRDVILDAGAALGRGCCPLVVSRSPLSPEECRTASLAVPGRMTTANALLTLTNLFHGPRLEMVFDAVIPAVAEGRTELGAIIHEGRFTYAAHGLHLVLDLGRWGEDRTGL